MLIIITAKYCYHPIYCPNTDDKTKLLATPVILWGCGMREDYNLQVYKYEIFMIIPRTKKDEMSEQSGILQKEWSL
jgi:hypothetical protein